MFELNLRLCELKFNLLGHTRSEVDILHVVPEQLLADDRDFVEYITESNNEIGDNQVRYVLQRGTYHLIGTLVPKYLSVLAQIIFDREAI